MDQKPSFAINAKTCTLKGKDPNNNATLLGAGAKYEIPVFQRPYSWDEPQLSKFITDIFTSFWGTDTISPEEPMFIGTMQLWEKTKDNKQQVIDGQQRLTTLVLLFRVLKEKFPACIQLNEIPLDWLSTKVNRGLQQAYLNKFLADGLSTEIVDENNIYSKNAQILIDKVNEQIKAEDENATEFSIDRFVNYLLTNIYFVVIETEAPLSKTIQIFNAINTTGMDLNGGDVFKIRMFEYLQKKKQDDDAFDKIDQLYSKTDQRNEAAKYPISHIGEILNIYQYILIAKYDLPTVLYTYATDTFFERLFDTIFGLNPWDHFKGHAARIELSIEEIDRIIDARYSWEEQDYQTVEDACAMNFIEWSRYSRYSILRYVFLYSFKNDNNAWEKLMLFIKELSKLYMIYSIRYQKVVNDMHRFTYSLVKNIINGSYETALAEIIKEIAKFKRQNEFTDILSGEIARLSKIKNLVCRLSAMLELDYKSSDGETIDDIEGKLFKSDIDIEHIQSFLHKNGELRADIIKTWGTDLHSIGNLMILEQSINRSIHNDPYESKIKRYVDSAHLIVKMQPNSYPEWDLEKCKQRKKKELKKIQGYLLNEILPETPAESEQDLAAIKN